MILSLRIKIFEKFHIILIRCLAEFKDFKVIIVRACICRGILAFNASLLVTKVLKIAFCKSASFSNCFFIQFHGFKFGKKKEHPETDKTAKEVKVICCRRDSC